jgi:excisionase family DNA binding protein
VSGRSVSRTAYALLVKRVGCGIRVWIRSCGPAQCEARGVAYSGILGPSNASVGRKYGHKLKRLTVSEAADTLKISEDAVRKRVQRGTLPHTKGPDGRVYVYMGSSRDAGKKAGDEESCVTNQNQERTWCARLRMRTRRRGRHTVQAAL